MLLAKAAVQDCSWTPNLGAFLLFNLSRQANQTRGDITCRGVIIVLATALGLNLGNLEPLSGERYVSFRTLRAVGMVFKRQGVYNVHIPGAGRLFPIPLPNNLFSLENGQLHFVAQANQEEVDPGFEEPNNEEPKVEEEEGAPEQEVPPPYPYTTYEEIYSPEGSIDNMSNLANSLRDTTQNMVEHFQIWSQVWNPENYLPPQ